VATKNSQIKVLALLLASSVTMQSNLSCLANDGSGGVSVAAIFSQAVRNSSDPNDLDVSAPDLTLPRGVDRLPDSANSMRTKGSEVPPVGLRACQLALASPSLSRAITGNVNGGTALDNSQVASTAVQAVERQGEKGDAFEKGPLVVSVGQAQTAEPYTLSGGASITADAALDRVDDLARQILLKEGELERFNLNYTKEAAKQGRWKGWRYALFQETNASMGLTGAIISVAYRGDRIHNPGAVHPAIQESANYIPMIGAIIGAGAAAGEFTINEYHEFQAGRKGFGPSEAIKHVQGLKNDIDRLMAERDALLKIEASAPTLLGHVEVDTAESKVLKDLRDQELMEFQRFHVAARKLLAFQQMQYFFDFAKYTTNAIGYEFAYLSLHRHHRVWNGRAGALFAVSGGLYMFGPIVSRLIAKGVGEIQKNKAERMLADAEGAQEATLQADLATMNRLFLETRIRPDLNQHSVERGAFYGMREKNFAYELQKGQKERSKAKLVATQNVGGGLYVGASKVASGIEFMIPGFNSHFNTKGDKSNLITNSNLFAASVIAIPASAYSMVDTLRIQVQGEVNRHKLMKAGMHPSQLLAARFKQLDDIEARLKK